jgi:hypothetical protein
VTSKGTPRRTIRVADDIWKPAEERAAQEGRTLVDVIRELLVRYGNRDSTTR